MANGKVVQNVPSCLLQVEIVSITALNLARMELELDLHLQQVRRIYIYKRREEFTFTTACCQQVRRIYIYNRWEERSELLQVQDRHVVKTR